MKEYLAFKNFSRKIISIYESDKDGFWDAVMSQFLSHARNPLQYVKMMNISLKIMASFQGLEKDALSCLREYSSRFNLDVTQWKSNRIQYFTDAYPVFAFLVIWMHENRLDDLLENFEDILKACVYAVSGYSILDDNVDSNAVEPVQILVSNALISEYESTMLTAYGLTTVNFEILDKMRNLFLTAEIREKAARWVRSPYMAGYPKALGEKAANAVTPYMLCLERAGKAEEIDAYWDVFLMFGAAIQMIDDWNDLEDDLAVGHYSYVTLGFENLYSSRDSAKVASMIRKDSDHVRKTYDTGITLLDQSRSLLKELGDSLLVRFVDITEARFNSFYKKEFGIETVVGSVQ